MPTASPLIYGQTLAQSTLTGGVGSVPGTFAWTNLTTVPIVPSDQESVTFTPTDTTDYNTVTGLVTVTVTKATPTITTLPTASAISVGQALSASTLTPGVATYNSTAVPGVFTWTTPTTIPGAGTPSESVTFTPTDAIDYNVVIFTIPVTVNNKTTPTVTAWPTATAITYGQTLASSNLSPGTASVAGTFAWTSPTTAPGAGTPSESVTFTPTDTTDYNTVANTITVKVNQATPTVTVPPTASFLSVGQTLAASTLAGGTASVPGAFAWTTPTTAPPLGADPESVTFTPTDTTDYTTTTVSVTVTVNSKTTPTITTLPTASPIIYGQTLAASVLTPGVASVPGTFAWTSPATVPGAGTPSESVTFTPSDTTDYNSVTGLVTLTVSKATPTITTPPTASAISSGQTLAASALAGGVASVPGTFAWTTPATIPPAGADPESVTFTPTDAADYNSVTFTVTVTVNNKKTPTITTLPTASGLTYGQALSASTLTRGVASVAWHVRLDQPGDSSRCGCGSGEHNLYAHRYDRLQHGVRYGHGYGEQGHADGIGLADSQHSFCRPDPGRVDTDGRHRFRSRHVCLGHADHSSASGCGSGERNLHAYRYHRLQHGDHYGHSYGEQQSDANNYDLAGSQRHCLRPVARRFCADGRLGFRCRRVYLDHAGNNSAHGCGSRERNLYAHRYHRLQHRDRYHHGYGE